MSELYEFYGLRFLRTAYRCLIDASEALCNLGAQTTGTQSLTE